jgi:hypothetical protein
MRKNNALLGFGILLALASSAFAAPGIVYNKKIASVKYIAPGNILLIWTSGGGYYRYMSNANGNNVESCKILLSVALAAFTSGNNVNLGVVVDNTGDGDPDDINSIDIRTPE